MKVLVVVDMQNDFIYGALGTKEAQNIVSSVCDKIKNFNGLIVYTRDTHFDDYMQTEEGKNLPVPHCIKNSYGWEIEKSVFSASNGKQTLILDKLTFGLFDIGDKIKKVCEKKPESIELIGVCTGICVISNAMILKAYYKEVPILVDGKNCACVTPESHENALKAMALCQINIK